jgi:hypothetical protein
MVTQYDKHGSRVLIKNKNEKWLEKSQKKKVRKVKAQLSTEDQALLATLTDYLTENRVEAVISKEPVTTLSGSSGSAFGKLLGQVAQDALADCKRDNPDLDFNSVTKEFNKLVAPFIRPFYVSAIRG